LRHLSSFLLILVVSFSGVPSAVAASLTVDEAVAAAVRQNPALEAASGDIAAAEAGSRAAGFLSNPQITFTPALTGPGGSDTEVLLVQPLELNGSRTARSGIARAHLSAARAQAVIVLSDLVYRTRLAYCEVVRAHEQHALAVSALQSAMDIDRLIHAQVDAGARPGLDALQSGIEVSRAQQRIATAEANVTAAESALNTLMGRPPLEPLPDLSLTPATADAVDPAAAISGALSNRVEITVEEATRDLYASQERQAVADGRPDLAPQFRADSVTRGGVRNSGIGIGISLPLIDYGNRRNQIAQARKSIAAQDARIDAARAQVRQETVEAVARVIAADKAVGLVQTGMLDQARQILDASKVGYREGGTGILALIDAERTYNQLQSDYQNAVVDAAVAHARLEWATGSMSPELLARLNPETGGGK